MKKIILLLWLSLLLTSCYSNPKDLEKISELEAKITEQQEKISQTDGIVIDILKWNWFTPDFAPRNIEFYVDNTHRFWESASTVLGWKYEIDWNIIKLIHSNNIIELELKWGDWDDTNFYLSNNDWEYFVKN